MSAPSDRRDQPGRERAAAGARDRKFAATLRLLSNRIATVEAHLGMAPAPNPMHRPAERVETDHKTRNGEEYGTLIKR